MTLYTGRTRRGRFGRLPRTVPSLTSTVIAIAQQMQSEEDSNIMDAWKNGGTYKGEKVTDEMVLAHWRQRLQGVDRNDPLYDTYKNNVEQLRYTIAYSKHYTAYLKGGRTDNIGMANFFQEWAKKVPHDSEFFRQLQQDAAGYVNLARAAARAGAARAAVAAYTAARNHTDRTYIQPAEYLNSIVDNYAKANGLIPNTPSANTGDLTTAGTAELYDKLQHASPDTVLYRTAAGGSMTVGDVRRHLGNLAPDLKFGITADDLNRINMRAARGAQINIRRANKAGYSSDADHYRTVKTDVTARATQDGTMSDDAQYWTHRTQFEEVRSDPYATNEQKLAAWEGYSQWLKNFARRVTDDNLRTRLAAEANLDTSQNSVAEDPYGYGRTPQTSPGTNQARNDITGIANDVNYLEQQKQLAALEPSGGAVWTTGNVSVNQQTGEVTFVPAPGGPLMGLTNDPAAINNLVFGGGNVLDLPSDWSPTGFKRVVLQGVPVTVSDRSVATTAGGTTATTQVATAFQYTDAGGAQRVMYQYTDRMGVQRFTAVPPWDPTLPTVVTPTGVTIDTSRYHLQGADAIKFAQEHPDFATVQIGGNSVPVADLTQNADGTWSQKVTDSNGGVSTKILAGQPISLLFTDPQKFITWTGGARTAAPQPDEDFLSLTQAALSSTPSGQQDWQKLTSNPTFSAQFRLEQEQTALSYGSLAPFVQAGANLQQQINAGNGVELNPLERNLFNWLVGPRPVGGDANVAQGVADHTAAVNAGTIPKTAPITIPAVGDWTGPQGSNEQYGPPVPPQIALSNLGGYASGYTTLERLGLLPPTRVAAGGHQPSTPPINVSGMITVPAPPAPKPVNPYASKDAYYSETAIYTPPPPPGTGGGGGGTRNRVR